MTSKRSKEVKIATEIDHLLTKLNCTLLLSAGGRLHFISGGASYSRGCAPNIPGLGQIAAGDCMIAASFKKKVVCMEPVCTDPVCFDGETCDKPATELAPAKLWPLGNMKPAEMAFGKEGLWAVDPEAGLLKVISGPYPTVSPWRAPLVPFGRFGKRGMALSGLAMESGSPAYVTAASRGFGSSAHGVVVHAPTKEIVAAGLPSPLSPRLSNGSLLVLDAKTRECAAVDLDNGKRETFAHLGGCPAGMALYGEALFICVNPSRLHRHKGLDPEPFSGVLAINRFTGEEIGRIEFDPGKLRLDGIQAMAGSVRPISNQAMLRSLARLGIHSPDSGRTILGKISRSLLALAMSGSFLLPFFPARTTAAPNPSEKLFEFQFGIHNPFSNGNPLYDANQHIKPAVAMVDIDGDGDMDAFLGTLYGEFLFFENIGTAQSPEFAAPVVNPFGIQPYYYYSYYYDYYYYYSFCTTPNFADIDGDGDFDLFFGSDKGYIYFAKNTGSATEPEFAAPQDSTYGIAQGYAYDGNDYIPFNYTAPVLADIDGDGDFDLFFGAKTDDFGKLLFQRNIGKKEVPQFGPVEFFPFNLSDAYLYNPNPEFVDIDGDGDLDVFIGDKYASVFFQKNTGNKESPNFGPQQYNPYGLESEFFVFYTTYFMYSGNLAPSSVDIDGDGDMDMFFGGPFSDLQFFKNEGSSSAPSFQAKGARTGYVSSPRLGDMDGDGDLDAFSGNWAYYYTNIHKHGFPCGEFPFFENTGTKTEPNFASPDWRPFGLSYLYGTRSLPALADIDGDGNLDLFSGTRYGGTWFYKNQGTPTSPAFANYEINPFGLQAAPDGNSAPNFGDIDDDGDLDAIIGERYGNFLIFENTGGKTSPAFDSPQSNPFGLTAVGYDCTPMLIDLDGDGDLDLFTGDKYGNILFSENSGDKSNPAFGVFSQNPFGLEPPLPNFFYYLQDGIGEIDENFRLPYYSVPELADIDGDGDQDAFSGDLFGRIHFFERQSPADVSVVKTADSDPVTAGETVTYTVRVDNSGPDTAWGVTVQDVLPEDTTLAGISGCENDPADLSEPCSLGMILAGQHKEFTISADVSPSASGSLTNEAEVAATGEDPVEGNNRTTLETGVKTSADLSVSKSTDTDPVSAGESMAYTIRVQNNGPSDARSVQVTDILPEGVDVTEITGCQSNRAGEAVPCSLGDIAASGFSEFTIAVDVGPSSSGVLANQVEVSSQTPDPDSTNNSVILNSGTQSVADLSLTKTSDADEVVAGESLTYTIRVNNSGPSDAMSVQVTDALPEEATVTDISGCQNNPAATSTPCSLGDIPAGQSRQYTIAVNVASSASGTITNTAKVATASEDPNPANNTDSADTTVTTAADLTLTVKGQTVQKTSADLEADIHASPGDEIQYTVTLRNNGPSDASNVVVDSSFSTLEGVAVDCSQSCAEDPAGFPSCSLGDIAAGTGQSFTINVTLSDSFEGELTFQASGSSDTDEIDGSDNSATLTVRVGPPIPAVSHWGAGLLASLLGIVSVFMRRRTGHSRR